jgi:hypothetical protein
VVVQDVKKGHFKDIEGDGLKRKLEGAFGVGATSDADGRLVVSYGALRSLKVKVLSSSELMVETESDKDASPELASDTIRRYNAFLESATGFNSKERSKRLQKKAKGGKL